MADIKRLNLSDAIGKSMGSDDKQFFAYVGTADRNVVPVTYYLCCFDEDIASDNELTIYEYELNEGKLTKVDCPSPIDLIGEVAEYTTDKKIWNPLWMRCWAVFKIQVDEVTMVATETY